MIIVDGGKSSVTEHHAEVRFELRQVSDALTSLTSSSSKVHWSSMISYERV